MGFFDGFFYIFHISFKKREHYTIYNLEKNPAMLYNSKRQFSKKRFTVWAEKRNIWQRGSRLTA